jgi:hypothetical protein
VFEEETTEKHERRIVRCRETTCNARIIFLTTEEGRKMPCDADTVEADDDYFDQRRHTPHFRTCSNPNKFSRQRRNQFGRK